MRGSKDQAFDAAAVKPTVGKVEVVPDSVQGEVSQQASRNGVYLFNGAVFCVVFALACGLFRLIAGSIGLFAVVTAGVLGLIAMFSVHIAQQWERIVVLRLGKFKCVKGPGLFFTIPLVEYCPMRIDQRVRSTAFGAEETLTSDLVPLNVDAVLFWMVYDAEKACTAVGDYGRAVLLSAQTVLRDAIGRAGAAEVVSRRNQLDRELKKVLEEKLEPWGISVLSVEIRDILLPKELQDVMSLEAQAEQKKKARMILAEAEQDISAMLGEARRGYDESDDVALELRKMHLLYEGIKESGGTVVVPSSWGDSFGEQMAKGLAGE